MATIEPRQGGYKDLGLTSNRYGYCFGDDGKVLELCSGDIYTHSEYTKNYFSIVIVCYVTYISIFLNVTF